MTNTNTRLMVTVDGGEPISWAAFAAANAEALGADGLAAVLRDLRACGEHVGGGGAGAEYTVHALDGAAHDLAVLREYAATRAFVLGELWTNGPNRWKVDAVFPDGRAILRSVATPWATTRALTVAEWTPGGWRREAPAPLSNLARFAREFSARDRATADRVEAAIESAMVVRGGGR